MKIKNINIYKTPLIQLQILKQYYKRKSYNFKVNIKQTEFYLNKISHIIYNYHIHNKKILFLGFPQKFKKLLLNTKHLLVPEYCWINGLLSNKNTKVLKTKTSFMQNSKQTTLKLKKKIDLVIIGSLNDKTTALEESHIARIPVIQFSDNLTIKNTQVTYETPEKFNFINDKIYNNNLFFSTIEIALKKAFRAKKPICYVLDQRRTLNKFYKGDIIWGTKNVKYKPKYTFTKKGLL